MQARINNFFKPSSSPITTPSTPTDDALSIWENTRNTVLNTYHRRSTIPHRNEVVKECIEKPLPKNLTKKRNYTQFHLELGQSDFLLRLCGECGIKYAPGDELDEKSHRSFHKNYMYGIPFKGWQNERAFTSNLFSKNRIVMVSEDDSPTHRNKVQEVVKMMEVELDEDWILHKHCKVYLCVSSQRISGCLVAEPIKEAFKVIALPDNERCLTKEITSSPSTTIQFGNIVLQREVSKRCRVSEDRLGNGAIVCDEEAKPAVCGIRAIWVSPSKRRKGLATWLLDTARESLSNNGCVVEKSQVAFSQPSSMGRAFGSNYFETCSFLVYKADTHFPQTN